MSGEFLAILAALAYGLAGVSIVRGKATARGDNGVFLSVVLTAILSWFLWLGWGTVKLAELANPDGFTAIAIFALAGIFSNVLGRQSMYRATEHIGAVQAGLLRRLTPLFALPCAFLILNELPGSPTLLGGALILIGVLVYMRFPSATGTSGSRAGLILGTLSPLAYALAYTFRGLGLDQMPDAAFGSCVGAVVAAGWFLAVVVIRKGVQCGWHFITVDRSARHIQTALALTTGQLLQFFALKTTTVVSVSVLGTLEVLFSALIILLFTKCEPIAIKRLLIASLLAMIGTALVVQE